jgi:hypothetical protein
VYRIRFRILPYSGVEPSGGVSEFVTAEHAQNGAVRES